MARTRVFHGEAAITNHLPPSHRQFAVNKNTGMDQYPRMGGFGKPSGMQSVGPAMAAHQVSQAEFPPDVGSLAGKGLHESLPSHVTGHRGTPRLRNAQPPASA
jgi:hypothetical protein